jgi:hypothetical protein
VEPSRHELLALDLLRIELGDFTNVERVDGQNPAHLGQTFDFAVRTADERWRAIEVTLAADETEIATRAAIDQLCRKLEGLIRQRSPGERSSFVLSGVIESRARVNDLDLDALVTAGLASELSAPSTSQAAELKRISRDGAAPRVYPLFASAAFVQGPENEERLRSALGRKALALGRGGEAGYETHLVLLQWALGSTKHWRGLLSKDPLTAPHPQFVWSLDFFPDPPSLTRLVPPRLRIRIDVDHRCAAPSGREASGRTQIGAACGRDRPKDSSAAAMFVIPDLDRASRERHR